MGPPSVARQPARSLIVAPRLPTLPEVYSTPFTSDGDVVADCDIPGCGYHIFGPRRDVGLALKEHHRLYHPDQIGVVLLNQPRQ